VHWIGYGTGVRAALRFFGNWLRLLFSPFWLWARWSARSKVQWVTLRLSPSLSQFRPREGLVQRLRARARDAGSTSLEELSELVEAIVRDPRVKGLLVHVPPLEAGWSACESVRDTLSKLRQAGKEVVCYLPEGGANRELFVALAASRIYLAPYSAFGPLGLASRPLYVRTLLDRIGVAVEAQSCGEYKSAAEPALRDSMSEPAREQLQALLSAMHAALFDALRQGRGFSEAEARALFDRALIGAKDALACKLVDGVVYENELTRKLDPSAEAAITASEGADTDNDDASNALKPMGAGPYLRLRTARLWQPLRTQPCIAIVPLRGTITGEQGGRWGSSIKPSAVTGLLKALGRDRRVRAVILYIDSPGGSALASEIMHHEIARLAAKKPVVACFGEVAASGGYYLACGCRKIVARSLAITGSIGVVSAKVSAGSLLDRLGVRPQFVRTSESADMLSFARGLSEREDALLRAHANELYARFLQVVAEGRGQPVTAIEPLARGRVWIGRDAQARGLVDVIGGVERALDEARALIDGLNDAQRAALKPRVYAFKTSALAGLTELRAALLGPLLANLPELALLDLARREPVSYYAPLSNEYP
jgi:protease-4